MEVGISDSVQKIVQQLVASGLFPDAEAAVNEIFMRGVNQTRLTNALNDHDCDGETPYEKARRLGLIGAASGLPSDLSSNEQHMEGFGRS